MSSMNDILNAKAAAAASLVEDLEEVLGRDANGLQIAEQLLAMYEQDLKADAPAAADFFNAVDELEAHTWVNDDRTWTPNMAPADARVFQALIQGFGEGVSDYQPSLWAGIELIKEYYIDALEHNDHHSFRDLFYTVRCAQRHFDVSRQLVPLQHVEQDDMEDGDELDDEQAEET
jgi:hypothetical protein